MLRNKTLTVTGGTGSFGNAIVKRFLETDIKKIVVFSRDEKKQDQMRRKYQSEKLRFVIGDVRDRLSVRSALHGADLVFHAAALKQVPSCEFFPVEAVKTNVLGANNVLTEAALAGVEKVIVLSTDKAVQPVNAMGMSKALMEKCMVANFYEQRDGKTIYCATRYGNVMASRGSVIPLFIEQIFAGKDLTVTDPNMTRFLMSIDEAVDLVLFGFNHAKGGEIFVKKAPASTIEVLANALLKLFKSKSQVSIIGTRHGEKLHETLLSAEELVRSEDLGDFFKVNPDQRNLNYSKYFNNGEPSIAKHVDYDSKTTTILNEDEVIELLMTVDYVKDKLKEWNELTSKGN
jgi:UDP-N-acetylglucosamine 4,6-dehydratase